MEQTTEQRRAQHAWTCAQTAKAELQAGRDSFKDYVNAAKGLPALIMNSGLMQVTAYLNGKKERRYEILSRHLLDWLHESQETPDNFAGFMGHLLKAEPREFQAITAEAFAWLKWLRQMAPAVEQGGA